ncbi:MULTISPECIES: hypothetical protein [Arenibacter]|nr:MULTISPECIES: hypothetical protein [Arenibacter]
MKRFRKRGLFQKWFDLRDRLKAGIKQYLVPNWEWSLVKPL